MREIDDIRSGKWDGRIKTSPSPATGNLDVHLPGMWHTPVYIQTVTACSSSHNQDTDFEMDPDDVSKDEPIPDSQPDASMVCEI